MLRTHVPFHLEGVYKRRFGGVLFQGGKCWSQATNVVDDVSSPTDSGHRSSLWYISARGSIYRVKVTCGFIDAFHARCSTKGHTRCLRITVRIVRLCALAIVGNNC